MGTDPAELSEDDLKRRVARELERTRRRSNELTRSVDDEDLVRQHSPLMSPLVWDLAHVGSQEEQWLVRDVGGRAALRPDIDDLYDAFQHRRGDRPSLPLLGPAESRGYVATVRDKVLDVLDRIRFEGRPLVDRGFAFGMIVQHEQQHDETMLATHQLRRGDPVLRAAEPPRPVGPAPAGEVFVPGGAFTMGTSTEPWALDNERPAHHVHVDAFMLDARPVTNGDFFRFIESGGYDQPRFWTEEGWAHRMHADLRAPLFWQRNGDTWMRRRFGHIERVPPDEPVVHVSFHEALAYATWAGKRLPTEAEWEKAARFDPRTGDSSRYPWGNADPDQHHANLGQRHLRPAAVGAYPEGRSPCGAWQLIGDVWEWTDTDFHGYPGFRAFPYREYSEVFFGTSHKVTSHKVLRGGSFGTDPAACRATFRNWDFPVRRQIFSGFRCARTPGEDESR